jgi:hypothetical protein
MREAEAEAEAVQRAKKYITHFAWHFEDERRPWGSRSSAIDKNKKSNFVTSNIKIIILQSRVEERIYRKKARR